MLVLVLVEVMGTRMGSRQITPLLLLLLLQEEIHYHRKAGSVTSPVSLKGSARGEEQVVSVRANEKARSQFESWKCVGVGAGWMAD